MVIAKDRTSITRRRFGTATGSRPPASWRHVIGVHSYHLPNADGTIGQDHLATMAEQFRSRMGERAPLWTCIGVAALANPTMRVEIQVTAMIDNDG
jgi:enamine deaminase RidA (YjgF/YER057c/UK114 family)